MKGAKKREEQIKCKEQKKESRKKDEKLSRQEGTYEMQL